MADNYWDNEHDLRRGKFERAFKFRKDKEATSGLMPEATPNAGTRMPMPQADRNPEKRRQNGGEPEAGLWNADSPGRVGFADVEYRDPLDFLMKGMEQLSRGNPAVQSGALPGGPSDVASMSQMLNRGFTAIRDVATRTLVNAAKGGDANALHTLIQQYMPMIYRRAGRVARQNPPIGSTVTPNTRMPMVAREDVADELIGQLGTAIKNYDVTAENRLEGYLQHIPKQSLKEARYLESTVPQPEHNPLLQQIRQMEETHYKKTGMRLADRTIARRFKITEAQAQELRARPTRRSGAPLEFNELEAMQEGRVPSALDKIEEADTEAAKNLKLDKVHQALDQLSESDRQIFMMYRDPDNPKTMQQIAQELGVSQQRINTRLKRAEAVVRDVVEGRGFRGRKPGSPPPIGGGSDAPELQWGDKPTRTRPLTPRELGTNTRELETNPRFTGDNPRFERKLRDKTDAYYRTELEKLGMRYDGKTDDLGGLHWYTDPKTGSTGVVRNVDDLKTLGGGHIEAQRRRFAKPISGGSDNLSAQGLDANAPDSRATLDQVRRNEKLINEHQVDKSVNDYRRFVNHGDPNPVEPDPQIVRQLQNPRQFTEPSSLPWEERDNFYEGRGGYDSVSSWMKEMRNTQLKDSGGQYSGKMPLFQSEPGNPIFPDRPIMEIKAEAYPNGGGWRKLDEEILRLRKQGMWP